jgi:hypothetical protein
MKKTVYISGAVTGEDFDHCFYKFMKAEKHLKDKGYEVINPMKEERKIKLTVKMMKTPFDVESWGIIMILLLGRLYIRADSIYMLKDWQSSQGAKIEKIFAERCGKEVLYE